ncbi:hypothetical protein ACFV4I_08050 [Nocardiopsis alba]|uniref:hypothetical protein n=1 Tax=Nocardiopsis alba TaxID=53437 RepID=UPI00365CA8FA
MSSPNDQNDLEFEEQLRRMLQAEADTVSPSAEGLNLIRERTERHRRSSWFGLPWLRPVAAVAAAVLIVASVIISSPQVRDQVLEMVPAGADREGTPPVAGEERDGDVVATSDESDPAIDGGGASEEPEKDREGSPSPDAEEGSDEEKVESAASCRPTDMASPSPSGSDREKDREGSSSPEDRDCDPEKEPTADPSSPSTDPGSDPDKEPEDNESPNGDGSGNGGGSGGGGSEEDNVTVE